MEFRKGCDAVKGLEAGGRLKSRVGGQKGRVGHTGAKNGWEAKK